jgi:hypothetical protein
MTITEFLLARITEDEASIDDLVRSGDHSWWGEVRYMDECEAKRAIVLLHLPSASHRWCITCTDIDALPPNNVEAYPCRTLRALALVYADHPDYDTAWSVT